MVIEIDFDKIKIRAIKPTDGSLLKEFENKIIAENLLISRKDKRTTEECNLMVNHMYKDVEKGRGVVLIAEYQDRIVGLSSMYFLRQKSGHIGDFGIMLDKNFRYQGLGYKLSQSLINMGKEKLDGLDLIQLGVFAENKPAIKLYEKLGFKVVARIPNKFKYENRYFEEILMHLCLN